MILRPYQEDAIQSVRKEIAAGHKRIILALSVGGGKTEIAQSIIQSAREKGKRVCFVVNRVDLLNQTSRRFKAAGIFHGIMQGMNTTMATADVLVASIQTMARRHLEQFDIFILDEAHAAANSKDYKNLIFDNKDKIFIGLTATPFSPGLGKYYDGLDGNLFESLVVGATIQHLIEQGFLVDVDVYAPDAPDMKGVKSKRTAWGDMDYVDSDVAKAADTPKLVGNIYAHWKRLSDGRPTIVFASSIDHSKHIVEEFRANGVAAEHLDYRHSSEERAEIFGRVRSGETLVLSNVALVAEGFDMPALATMILARPTKSLIRFIQMTGRILRPHDSKDRAILLDHSGSVERLGFPTDNRDMELDDGKPKTAAKKPEKEKPLPKPCPVCSYMRQPGDRLCPKCGYVFYSKNAIEVEEGELKKLERKPKVQRDEKQEYYSWLISEQRDRGYKTGYVAHRYKHRFGVWPRGLMDWDYPEYTRRKKLSEAITEIMPA